MVATASAMHGVCVACKQLPRCTAFVWHAQSDIGTYVLSSGVGMVDKYSRFTFLGMTASKIDITSRDQGRLRCASMGRGSLIIMISSSASL